MGFLFIIAMSGILHKPLTLIIFSNYSPYFCFFLYFLIVINNAVILSATPGLI